MIARDAMKTGDTAPYEAFLKEAGAFSPQIFADRLYTHYRRVRQLGAIADRPGFDSWAADFLAEALTHPPDWAPPTPTAPVTDAS